MYKGLGQYKVLEDFKVRFNLTTCGTICKGAIVSAIQEDHSYGNVCTDEFGWISNVSPYWKYMEKIESL